MADVRYHYENGPTGASDQNPATNIDLTAATPTAVQTVKGGSRVAIASTAAFNILFGSSAVGNPADNAVFPAGVHIFRVRNPHTSFKLTPNANGKLTWWRESTE